MFVNVRKIEIKASIIDYNTSIRMMKMLKVDNTEC